MEDWTNLLSSLKTRLWLDLAASDLRESEGGLEVSMPLSDLRPFLKKPFLALSVSDEVVESYFLLRMASSLLTDMISCIHSLHGCTSCQIE